MLASLAVKGTPLWATVGRCLEAEELFRRSCSRALLHSGEAWDTDLVRGVGVSSSLVGGFKRAEGAGPTMKVADFRRLEGLVLAGGVEGVGLAGGV